jgi:tetratricopeptide repeat protein
VAFRRRDWKVAEAHPTEALAVYREQGYPFGIAAALGNLGMVAREQGDLATARALVNATLPIWQELENTRGLAWRLDTLAHLARSEGN